MSKTAKKNELFGLFLATTGRTIHHEKPVDQSIAKITGYWPSRITDYQTFGGRR